MADKTPEEIAAETAAADAAKKAADDAAVAAKAAADAADAVDGEDKLGDPGRRALEAIRESKRKAAARATELEAELAKYRKADKDKEDASKSEQQKAEERAAALSSRADAAELTLLKVDVGLDKGLTKAQSLRLVGKTKEELEADADDLLETFGATAATAAPNRRPVPKLRGGATPQNEPDVTDPKALAALIKR
jgi:Sec-independent protein translocase protein TatA